MSNRRFDSKQERTINEFLLRFFFKKQFQRVENVGDQSRQLLGMDIIADGMIIDNKAQSSPSYINKPTSTFVLELSSLDRIGIEHKGWFIDPKSVTTHYLFVWVVDAKVDKTGALNYSKDINKLEVMLVEKYPLKKYINSFRDDETLHKNALQMRKMSLRHGPTFPVDGIHYSYTSSCDEEPVNLVVSKDILKNYAIMHCYVTNQEIIKI